MKNIFKYIMGVFVVMAAAASCDRIDYPDRFRATDGVPTVDYIRYADKDVFITQAYMDEVLCIVGENLRSVHDLYFNDQAAILNTSYMTDNTIIASVPSTQAVEQTDKIYLVTASGETVSVDFKVLPPAPKISSMSNEWAPVGSTVTLTGKYFIDVTSLSFSGAEVTDYTVNSTESITLTIPEGAINGPLSIVTESGSAYSSFHYLDTRGMLFDFDGMTGLDNHGWNGHSSSTDATALSGNFIQLGNGEATIDESTWDEDHFSFVYWPGSWNDPENYEGAPRLTDFADFSDWGNMTLKFEMMIPSANPWTGCALQICFAGVDKVSFGSNTVDIYGNTVAGANNNYMTGEECPRAMFRPWTTSGSFDTADEWITVSIPLSEFIYGWSGAQATGSLTADSFTSCWFFLCQGGVAGTACAPVLKIDNIRVVPL